MAAPREPVRMDHPIIITLLILAIIAFMYFAAEVLQPLALAVLLSLVLAPLADFLQRRGLPRVPAVVLSVVTALGLLGGVVYVVGQQLTTLAANIDQYQVTLHKNLAPLLTHAEPGTIEKLQRAAEDVTKQDAATERDRSAEAAGPVRRGTPKDPVSVEIVDRPTFQERLQTAVGPYLEPVAVGFFVLILVMFLLINRGEMGDRVVGLFGGRHISLTTRTMDEVGRRISRYLGMFAAVNSTFGLIAGLGLWAIGVPLATLWGFLAAVLRFIPYVGPATAFALPVIFAAASFEGWRAPLMVIALFGVMEALANSFLEPIIYGRTTGVSAFGLLVAAMFWTWLWGPLGLLLSTPLTVCLAVLGKYVPSLGAFATLLGEEAELEPDVRFYQRLLALDQDGASELVEEALKTQPRAEVFDAVLLPALSRAERDRAREEIDQTELAFAWRVVGDILDELEGTPELALETLADAAHRGDGPPAAAPAPEPEQSALGVASNDAADALALRMLALALRPAGVGLEILTEAESRSPLHLADRVADREPRAAVLSHLPPRGLTPARYLTRRLRARLPELPIVVGRWGLGGDAEQVRAKLSAAGASRVAFRIAEARDQVVEVLRGRPANPPATPPEPLPADAGTAPAGRR